MKQFLLKRTAIVKLPRRDRVTGRFTSDQIKIVGEADRSDRSKTWFRFEFYNAREPRSVRALLGATRWCDGSESAVSDAMDAIGLSMSAELLGGGTKRQRRVLDEVIDMIGDLEYAVACGRK